MTEYEQELEKVLTDKQAILDEIVAVGKSISEMENHVNKLHEKLEHLENREIHLEQRVS